MPSVMEALANLVAAIHIAYFLFVIGGLVFIAVGARQGLAWVYNPAFRLSHLCTVLFVLAEDVFNFPCPLNLLEGRLRATPENFASEPSQATGLLDLLLHHTIPGWFLDTMYWVLGGVLLLLMFWIPPRFSWPKVARHSR